MNVLTKQSCIPLVRSIPSTQLRLISTVKSTSGLRVDLTFPNKADPNPFEIFGLKPGEELDRKEVKRRYYLLARKYHPDSYVSSSESSASTFTSRSKFSNEERFHLISLAYSILSSPSLLMHYIHTGQGWIASSTRSPLSEANRNIWKKKDSERNRPMRPMSSRGTFTSGSYDWGPGWDGRGMEEPERVEVRKDRIHGTFIVLSSLAIFLYSIQFFRANSSLVNLPSTTTPLVASRGTRMSETFNPEYISKLEKSLDDSTEEPWWMIMFGWNEMKRIRERMNEEVGGHLKKAREKALEDGGKSTIDDLKRRTVLKRMVDIEEGKRKSGHSQ